MSKRYDTDIVESIKEAARKIESASRRGPVSGIVTTASTPGAKELLKSWGFVEVSPNYWKRKNERMES